MSLIIFWEHICAGGTPGLKVIVTPNFSWLHLQPENFTPVSSLFVTYTLLVSICLVGGVTQMVAFLNRRDICNLLWL